MSNNKDRKLEIALISDSIKGTGTNHETLMDKNGNYIVSLGAFNVFNSSGSFYPFFDELKSLFVNQSSPLLARMSNGTLKGECEHPRRLPVYDDSAWIARMNEINTQNVSHSFMSLHLVTADRPAESTNTYDKGKVIDVVGGIQPDGPYGTHLEAALKNPKVNVAFSIRGYGPAYSPFEKYRMDNIENAFVRDTIKKYNLSKGHTIRFMNNIITWDWVSCPGIPSATTNYLKGNKNVLKIKQKISDGSKIGMLESKVNPYQEIYFEEFAISKILESINSIECERLRTGSNLESDNLLKELKEVAEKMVVKVSEHDLASKMILSKR